MQYHRDSLTWDYSIFDQARYLIAHGSLDPFDTLNGFPYWRNHGELIMWPVAWLSWLPPHGFLLLLLQAGAAAGGGWVALDIVRVRMSDPLGRGWKGPFVLGLASALIVADPWVYWANGWDFHFQALASLFVLLVCRELCFGGPRWRIALWSILTVATGDVSSTYLVGAGLIGLVVAPARRKDAVVVAGCGVLWLAALTIIGANRGSGLQSSYGFLAGGKTVSPSISAIIAGAVEHPSRVLSSLGRNAADVWANVAGGGVAGVFSPWGMFMAAVVLLPSAIMRTHLFINPGFQSLPCYAFLAIGSAGTCAWLLRRGRLGRTIGVLTAVTTSCLTVAWSAAWLPLYPSTWMRVAPAAGARLVALSNAIPARAEVIASQGVLGRFASRRFVYGILSRSAAFPLHGRSVWFVFAPAQGIEIPVQETFAMMEQVATLPGVRLEASGEGVWAFEWNPPTSRRSLHLSGFTSTVAGWESAGPAGRPLTSGPPAGWRAVWVGRPGYVVSGDYWYLRRGAYEARAVVASSGPLSVQVWDSASGQLLAERRLASTVGRVSLLFSFQQTLPGNAPLPNGPGPFHLARVDAPNPGWPVEIRVYTPGDATISVYSIGISPNPRLP